MTPSMRRTTINVAFLGRSVRDWRALREGTTRAPGDAAPNFVMRRGSKRRDGIAKSQLLMLTSCESKGPLTPVSPRPWKIIQKIFFAIHSGKRKFHRILSRVNLPLHKSHCQFNQNFVRANPTSPLLVAQGILYTLNSREGGISIICAEFNIAIFVHANPWI